MVTNTEAELLDTLDKLPTDTVATFERALHAAVAKDAPHPLTTAAAFAEIASYLTPTERGERPAPQPPEF